MTILGRRLFYDYPQYYNIFSRREDDAGIATVRNTNRALLDAYRGADGIKTGYTRAAGFNLVASAERGNVRVIATVFGGRSAAWRNQRIMELFDMGFARAPANATVRRPSLPVYTDDDGGGGTAPAATLMSGLVTRSLRPLPRPGVSAPPAAAPPPELVAAIEEAVGAALTEAVAPAPAEAEMAAAAPEAPPAPAPRPAEIAVAPATPVPAAEEEAAAEVEVARAETPANAALAAVAPVPRPVHEVALAVPPRPADPPPAETETEIARAAEPEVVTRASSTGSRLFGVSLGAQPSHHAAERLLLRTALSEIGTFDQALRRVVQRGGGYEARFQGMTEDQAARACARLGARNIPCETFGPAS
jgi:D-alanyl-D-alanine carboxypeptidase